MSVCHLLSCLQPLQPFHWLGLCRRFKRSSKPLSKRSLRTSTKTRKSRCQCMKANSERKVLPRQLSPLVEESQRTMTRSESSSIELIHEKRLTSTKSPSIPIPKANRSDKSFLDSTSLSLVGGPPSQHLMPLPCSLNSYDRDLSIRSMDQVDGFRPNDEDPDSKEMHATEPTKLDCHRLDVHMDEAKLTDDAPIANRNMNERQAIEPNARVENVEMISMNECVAKASDDQSQSAPSERVLSCTFKFSNISCTDRTQSTSTSNVTSTNQSKADCLSANESCSLPSAQSQPTPTPTPTPQSQTKHSVAPLHSALAAASSTPQTCAVLRSTAAAATTTTTAPATAPVTAQRSTNINTTHHSPNVPDTSVSFVCAEMNNNNIDTSLNQNHRNHNNSVVIPPINSEPSSTQTNCLATNCSSRILSNTSIVASNEDIFATNSSNEAIKKDEHEEELWIDVLKSGRPLGLQLVAGRFNDRPVLLVHELIANGAAAFDGRIRVGDILRQVDEQPLHTSDVQFANTCLGRSLSQVRLLIQRIRLQMADLNKETESNQLALSTLIFDNCLYQRVQVNLQKRAGRPLGISLLDRCTSGPGSYITEIQTNSVAQLEGSLRIGDHILTVNGHDVSALSSATIANSSSALMALKSAQGTVQIQIARLCPGFVIDAPSFSSPMYATSVLSVKSMYFKAITLNRINNSFGFSVAPNLMTPLNQRIGPDGSIEINSINLSYSSKEEFSQALLRKSSSSSSVSSATMMMMTTDNVKSKSSAVEDHQMVSISLSNTEPPTNNVDNDHDDDDDAPADVYDYDDDDHYSEAVATIGRDWVKVQMQSKSKLHLSPQCDTLHVIQIQPNGACADESQLKVGDRIIQINGLDVNRLKVAEVIRLLRTTQDRLQLIVIDSLA